MPAGTPPFPAIVFDRGQGGFPQGYPNLEAMRGWGAVVIAPTLTHVLGVACVDALASLAAVDPARRSARSPTTGSCTTSPPLFANGFEQERPFAARTSPACSPG